MLEIGGDSWGWQKWESLWEPIDDDLYLRRGRCSSNTRQLAHNNNWMGCQYQQIKQTNITAIGHQTNNEKVWFEALLFSAVARPERKVERDFSLCQFWTSLRQWDEQGVTWKFPFKGENIFEDFLPQWLHLQKQSVPSWWRRVWQQLKQATFLLEKSNYPTLLTATLKWHFLRKHLKYIKQSNN